MNWAYLIVGIAVAVGPTLVAYAALRKRPAETQKINVDTVDVNVTLSGKVRDLAGADWKRVVTELDDLRAEFAQYRTDTDSRMAEMAAELRAEKAEKVAVKAENDRLRHRVDELEDEVARLKATNDQH